MALVGLYASSAKGYSLECWPVDKEGTWHARFYGPHEEYRNELHQQRLIAALKWYHLLADIVYSLGGRVVRFPLEETWHYEVVREAFYKMSGSSYSLFRLEFTINGQEQWLYYGGKWAWAGSDVSQLRYARVFEMLQASSLCEHVYGYSIDDTIIDGIYFDIVDRDNLLEQLQAVAAAIAGCP